MSANPFHGGGTKLRKRATQARHPQSAKTYLSLQDLMNRGDLPNVISEFLRAWSFRLSRPTFQPGRNMMPDVGMVFDTAVPAKWISLVEEIDDASLHGGHGA